MTDRSGTLRFTDRRLLEIQEFSTKACVLKEESRVAIDFPPLSDPEGGATRASVVGSAGLDWHVAGA